MALGSGILVIPIVHRCYQFPLAPFRMDFTGTQLDTGPARSLQLANVFQIAVGTDREMILLAGQRLSALLPSESIRVVIRDIVLDELERVLAQQNEESEDSPANRFIDGVEEALNTIGFTIVACRRL